MSIATQITRLNNNIEAMKNTKQQIKDAVNNDFDIITNEQIENYDTLIENGLELYKQYIPPVETNQATDIQVTDAMKCNSNKLELFGNTSQDSTSGSQAIDYSEVINREVNFNDVTLLISTTNFNIKADTTYYIRWIFTDNTYVDASSTLDNIRFYNGTSIQKQFGGTNQTFTSQELDGITSVQVRATTTFASTYAGKTIKALVFSSDSNKITPDTYEPYTGGVPSPNTDYPQDIHVVTGENTIEVQGKNLIPGEVFEFCTITNTGEKIQDSTRICTDFIELDTAKQYFLSASIVYGFSGIAFYDNTYTYISRLYWNNSQRHTIATTDIPNNTKYAKVFGQMANNVIASTSEFEKNEWYLEEGDSNNTKYVPYYHADYPINLGSIELCKIGNYQDYLYKENGNWYKYEIIKKIILNGSETNWSHFSVTQGDLFRNTAIITDNTSDGTYAPYSKYYQGISYNNSNNRQNNQFYLKQVDHNLDIIDNRFSVTNDFKTWLSNNNVPIYYVLANPTPVQITDETLISQLEAIYNHLALVKGVNHITITPSDLEPYMKLSYKNYELTSNE